MLPLVDAIPAIIGPRGKPGRPRFRPAKLHGDKAYNYPALRHALRTRGLTARIALRGIDSSKRLGRHRWVVERPLSWLLGCRRLGVRYERRADLLLGLLNGACALFCPHYLAPMQADAHRWAACRAAEPSPRGRPPPWQPFVDVQPAPPERPGQ